MEKHIRHYSGKREKVTGQRLEKKAKTLGLDIKVIEEKDGRVSCANLAWYGALSPRDAWHQLQGISNANHIKKYGKCGI